MKTLFPKTNRHRRLRLEPLEERQMLSVSPAEFDAIRAQYPDLNLGEYNSYNCIDVTNLTGESLQAAIDLAGNTSVNDLIVVRTTGTNHTIKLSGGELGINIDAAEFRGVTIVSFGTDPLIIDAQQQSRVFNIASGSTVALAGLTMTGGWCEGETWNGGDGFEYEAFLEYLDSIRYVQDWCGSGILNFGTLTVTGCTITESSLAQQSGSFPADLYRSGGGIYNLGALTVTGSTISNNAFGIVNGAGSTNVENCTITGNQGFGIGLDTGTLTVTGSTITETYGSGILAYGLVADSTLEVTNCIITGNYETTMTMQVHSAGISIGLFNSNYGNPIVSVTAMITNSVIAGNHCAGIGYGSDNSDLTTNLTIINCTITGNNAGILTEWHFHLRCYVKAFKASRSSERGLSKIGLDFLPSLA